jgi:hypothetical protein
MKVFGDVDIVHGCRFHLFLGSLKGLLGSMADPPEMSIGNGPAAGGTFILKV